MLVRLKALIWKIPGARAVMKPLFHSTRNTFIRLNCFLYDMGRDRRYSFWRAASEDYDKLTYELIFQHHKLEKGLCLPPDARPFFGEQACDAVLELLERWRRAGYSMQSPVWLSSLEVLRAYEKRLTSLTNSPSEVIRLRRSLADFLAEHPATPAFSTPIRQSRLPVAADAVFEALSHSRRSVRNFDARPVETSEIERAVKLAQLSPSACNRQPCKVHVFLGQEKIHKFLDLQNGNSGFGHRIPVLVAITADLKSAFDATERVGPVLDGGLFLMSFLFALQSRGISSCCLNWAVRPATDRKGHEVSGIPENERILTLLAIGYAADDCAVPRSARRPLQDVLSWH